MNDKVIELARKLLELSKRGVGGEKENAKDHLERICKKHGISLIDIEGEKLTRFPFKIPKAQQKFFIQVAASVRGNFKWTGWDGTNTDVELTDAEYIEIKEKYEYFWKLWSDESEVFYAAFIQKHKLYRNRKPDEEYKPNDISLDEQMRMISMMGQMKQAELQKKLNR